MLKKIRDTVSWFSSAMSVPIGFSVFAALLFQFLPIEGAWVINILVGAAIFLGACGEEFESKFVFIGWALMSGVLFVVFQVLDISISITRAMSLLGIVLWSFLGIDHLFQRWKMALKKKSDLAEEKKTKAKAKERKALVKRINNLIGSEAQTKALLLAIERLTPYAQEEANHILRALSRDAERYVLLRSLEETSVNDVLKRRCRDEADSIATSARTLCAEATEMALELLLEHQQAELEERLGEVGGRSELAKASQNFRKYLEGLREVNDSLTTHGADEKLRQEIEDLRPKALVKELPVGKTRKIR